jgi:hypothetical protein
MPQVAVAFRVPPGWPDPPPGWLPPRGWEPPEHWPPAPSGWEYYLELPSERDHRITCRASASVEARDTYTSTVRAPRSRFGGVQFSGAHFSGIHFSGVGMAPFIALIVGVALFGTLALRGAFASPEVLPPGPGPAVQACAEPPRTTGRNPAAQATPARKIPTGTCRS